MQHASPRWPPSRTCREGPPRDKQGTGQQPGGSRSGETLSVLSSGGPGYSQGSTGLNLITGRKETVRNLFSAALSVCTQQLWKRHLSGKIWFSSQALMRKVVTKPPKRRWHSYYSWPALPKCGCIQTKRPATGMGLVLCNSTRNNTLCCGFVRGKLQPKSF